jgi:ADP-ribose pyrophosphatase YjhB (NUDIX family)
MKIFLNEKTIELLDSAPTHKTTEPIVEYTNEKQLLKAYSSFKNNDTQSTLIIWSGKKNGIWKKEFTKNFKKIKAGGGVVKNESGEILFIYRLGKWDLPKGKFNPKETPEQAAIREVKEETGIKKLKVTKSLPSTYHIYERKNKQILKQTWWFEMQSTTKETLIPQTSENITDLRWIPKENIKLVLQNTYASIKELIFTL